LRDSVVDAFEISRSRLCDLPSVSRCLQNQRLPHQLSARRLTTWMSCDIIAFSIHFILYSPISQFRNLPPRALQPVHIRHHVHLSGDVQQRLCISSHSIQILTGKVPFASLLSTFQSFISPPQPVPLLLLQEVEGEAKWKEAGRREEAVPGARVHKDPRGGFWPQRAGGAAQRDRPQRMARQQQWVTSVVVSGLKWWSGGWCPENRSHAVLTREAIQHGHYSNMSFFF